MAKFWTFSKTQAVLLSVLGIPTSSTIFSRWGDSCHLTPPQPKPPAAGSGGVHPFAGGCGGVTAGFAFEASWSHRSLARCVTLSTAFEMDPIPKQQHLQAGTQRLQGAQDTALFSMPN